MIIISYGKMVRIVNCGKMWRCLKNKKIDQIVNCGKMWRMLKGKYLFQY
jgi:DUF1009 family protein